MRTIGLRSQSDREFFCPAGKIGFLVLTAVYAALGDKDKAFEWLDKDFQARNQKLVKSDGNFSLKLSATTRATRIC